MNNNRQWHGENKLKEKLKEKLESWSILFLLQLKGQMNILGWSVFIFKRLFSNYSFKVACERLASPTGAAALCQCLEVLLQETFLTAVSGAGHCPKSFVHTRHSRHPSLFLLLLLLLLLVRAVLAEGIHIYRVWGENSSSWGTKERKRFPNPPWPWCIYCTRQAGIT